MSDGTKIEWTDATWNPVTGCTRISEGCERCYIERTPPFRMAGRLFVASGGDDGFVDSTAIGSSTGVQLHPDRLTQPLRWRKPRRVFVCSLADLFHAAVPVEHIARVWAAMAVAGHHTFQVLTKRAARLRSVLSDPEFRVLVAKCAGRMVENGDAAHDWVLFEPSAWPLRNVWVGVSAETQQWANLRIPQLLQTPAAVRWVSAEPLLGPLDLTPWLDPDQACEHCDAACPTCPFDKAVVLAEDWQVWADGVPIKPGPAIDQALAAGQTITDHQPIRTLDWVVAGGESGPGARPMAPHWARALRDQCAAADVAFLFKQWGEWAPGTDWVDGRTEDIAELGNPGAVSRVVRVGKKAAGRELDGCTHDAYPAERGSAA